ncbi:MAG TPA: hypothetical protein VD757_01115, partial [Candidatus Nitrosocosmicus sp.]|nr:hypothetical protein [Candidatus Nitrosocosmicus sp.]
MGKNIYYNKMFLLLIAAAVYLITIIIGSQLLSNIVSPIVALMTGYIIWVTSRQRKNYRLNWTLLAILA